MTKYEQKSFNSPANSKAYVDNWDRIFGKKCEHEETELVVDLDTDKEVLICIDCNEVVLNPMNAYATFKGVKIEPMLLSDLEGSSEDE